MLSEVGVERCCCYRLGFSVKSCTGEQELLAVGDSAGTFMLKARSDPLRCCDDRDECLQMVLSVWSTSADENQGGIKVDRESRCQGDFRSPVSDP